MVVTTPDRSTASQSEEHRMTIDYDSVDIFTDESLRADPYPYFEHLRSKCPITNPSREGVVGVTGYDEAFAILKDPHTSEEHHGPPGARTFEFTPTFVLRGIEKLHLTCMAVAV